MTDKNELIPFYNQHSYMNFDNNLIILKKLMLSKYSLRIENSDLKRILKAPHFKYVTKDHKNALHIESDRFKEDLYNAVCVELIHMKPPNNLMIRSREALDIRHIQLFNEKISIYNDYTQQQQQQQHIQKNKRKRIKSKSREEYKRGNN